MTSGSSGCWTQPVLVWDLLQSNRVLSEVVLEEPWMLVVGTDERILGC